MKAKKDTQPFVSFEHVKKSFSGKQVYRDLNLTLGRGETLTLLGGSGSGKTVLLKLLLGLLDLDSGIIRFDGQDLTGLDEQKIQEVRRRIGMVFQGGALFDSLSVRENVAYPLREHMNSSEEEIDKIVAEKLELVGLPGIEEKMPGDLSGGMKKRVALARAIAIVPEVILYDEPTAGLDPTNTNRIDNLICQLQERLNVTSMVVTHNIASAMKVSDRIALLYNGKIEFVGTKAEIQKSDNEIVQGFLKGELDDAPPPEVEGNKRRRSAKHAST